MFYFQASVKNFQLIRESQPDVVIMQFGKLSEEKFILDFRYSFLQTEAFLSLMLSLCSLENYQKKSLS